MTRTARKERTRERLVIYQLLPRLFGNTRRPVRVEGSREENGCGTFADLDDLALDALRDLGVNALWLTGVLEHATRTAYPGVPADDPDIVKGTAGSPYAVRDLFDVAADLARDPARRKEEFEELCARCHRHGLRVLLDFVPNHVARSHRSDVRPELALGDGDDRTRFFARDNHFFYLGPEHPGGGPPLRLPDTTSPGCDGRFDGELSYGRVTGNNAATWAPSPGDWYETVKLNLGHDYTAGRDTSHLPGPEAALGEVPRTWRVLDASLAHWQALGVDGFRVDMAHLVPLEFWRWVIHRARSRDAAVFFCAEAYDNDPAKLCDTHVMDALLEAGFDAVYDDPLYDVVEGIYEDGKWCNDLDALLAPGPRFDRGLRYGENHDEVRLAHPRTFGGLGMEVGRAVCGAMFLLGRGPLLLYMGQEVGEPALGERGFGPEFGGLGAGNARTSIFDYGWCPALAMWLRAVRGGPPLESARQDLRRWYRGLLALAREPVFQDGETFPLNGANVHNQDFGRVAGDGASGHYVLAFLRLDRATRKAALVVVNFHPTRRFEAVQVRFSAAALSALGVLERGARSPAIGVRRWGSVGSSLFAAPEDLDMAGVSVGGLEPLDVCVLEVSHEA